MVDGDHRASLAYHRAATSSAPVVEVKCVDGAGDTISEAETEYGMV